MKTTLVVSFLLLILLLCWSDWLSSAAVSGPYTEGSWALQLSGRAPMTIEVLHPDPLIRCVRGFVSPEEAQELIDTYKHLLRPSTVSSSHNHVETSMHDSRRSSTAYLPPGCAREHPLIRRIEERACALAGKSLKHMETLQLLRYEGANQFYKSHFDYFHDKPKSQRTTTIFVYLNDTQGEGATDFPRLKLQVLPETGKACIWENCHLLNEDCHCESLLEHAGLPLKSDEKIKYGLNIWFRTGVFRG